MKPKTIPWTFKNWIANFNGVDLPIGDLAQDISRDPNFPDSEDREELRSYLSSKAKHHAVIETFETVWDFYQASR
ncbi:YozE family protein [Paenibacillus woosongensis]|uniref:YozE family protein n=1 Tax=Paenibacillus woosongensis TaxID=307580 RepID=A0AA95IDQ1_9BACL|nr:YozE family protein [Paenibacillus woosongensis]WHX50523.1 YozE family protein [Paenibacillus woosongensis]